MPSAPAISAQDNLLKLPLEKQLPICCFVFAPAGHTSGATTTIVEGPRLFVIRFKSAICFRPKGASTQCRKAVHPVSAFLQQVPPSLEQGKAAAFHPTKPPNPVGCCRFRS